MKSKAQKHATGPHANDDGQRPVVPSKRCALWVWTQIKASTPLAAGATAAALLVPVVAKAQADTATGFASPVASYTLVDTGNLAFPSAKEVIVDLPSVFHASRYQQGDVNGLRYVLFPDGSGKIMPASGQRTVLFWLDCTAATSCTITGQDNVSTVITAVGAQKPEMPTSPDAEALARYLAEWVLAGTAVNSLPAEQQPIDDGLTRQAPVAEIQPTELAEPTPTNASTPLPKQAIPSAKPNQAVLAPAPASTTQLLWPNSPPRRSEAKPGATARKSFGVSEAVVSATREQPKRAAEPAQEREPWFQRVKLSCSITSSFSLRYKHPGTGTEKLGKPRASLGCGGRLSEKLSLRVSVIGYGDSSAKSATDAEFTYAFTYRATEKVTLTYSNYSGRFSDSRDAFMQSLGDGTFGARYQLPKITLPNDKTIGCSASVGIAKLEDTRASLSCSYAVTDKFRISGSAFAYLPGKQENWEPDFSYTASYRISDDWSVTYSNYANNRFFWNRSISQEGFLNGTLSVSYRFKF